MTAFVFTHLPSIVRPSSLAAPPTALLTAPLLLPLLPPLQLALLLALLLALPHAIRETRFRLRHIHDLYRFRVDAVHIDPYKRESFHPSVFKPLSKRGLLRPPLLLLARILLSLLFVHLPLNEHRDEAEAYPQEDEEEAGIVGAQHRARVGEEPRDGHFCVDKVTDTDSKSERSSESGHHYEEVGVVFPR